MNKTYPMNNNKMKFKLVSFENKEQWKNWRDSGLTPEDTSALMGENPWESHEDLLKRKTQESPTEKTVTEAMNKAKEHRPLALEAYKNEYTQYELSPHNIQSVTNPWLIAHVDLFDLKKAHLVEVRCGEGAYNKAVDKPFPPKPYWAEAQHILALTGLKFITMYFHNGNPDKLPFTVKIWRKEEYISRMLTEAKNFMNKIHEIRNREQYEKLSPIEVETLKAKEALENEKQMARKVYEAVIGKSSKVDKQTYQKYVPSHFDNKGKLTPLGQSLLL
jgi:putative phage-type endonuclease